VRRAGLWLLVLPAIAFAMDPYNYLAFKNLSDAQHPLLFYVDNRSGNPAGVDVNQVKNAADSAWAAWNAVSCAVPKSQDQGFTGTTVPSPSNPYDIYNVTPVFITDTNDPYFDTVFGFDLSAVTLPLQYAGVLQACDIYLNGTDRQWSTGLPVPPGSLDVQTVMLHEAGHCLGLDHQPNYPESVMQGDVLPGVENRMLSATDDDILCQRYPISNGVGSPCTGAGTCGSTVPGIACVTQVITGQPTHQFCTVGCDTGTGAGCDVPFTCQPSTAFAGHNGACLLPGTSVTPIGKACDPTMPMVDCQSSVALCKAQTGVYWQDGYCTQSCAAGQPACPAGSACITVNDAAGTNDICLQSCRVGFPDCRPGYTCALVSAQAGGVCIPRCFQDSDCGQGYSCRTCDGLCTLLNATTQVGDPCQLDTNCGFGQVCLPLTNYSVNRQCTLPCGTGCGGCPSDATCQPLPTANGQMFCLLNCTQQFDCPTGLMCQNLPTGRACMPPCNQDADCAVGLVCTGGTCIPPGGNTDAGCDLCPSGGGGGGAGGGGGHLTGHGGGATGGGGTDGGGGCGCGAVETAPLMLLGLLLRRRAWRRRP
jgi:hypothetical protein